MERFVVWQGLKTMESVARIIEEAKAESVRPRSPTAPAWGTIVVDAVGHARNAFLVRVGDLGGYIEQEHNLSQIGQCWVHYDAHVTDQAAVYGHAQIRGRAQISDEAEVCERLQDLVFVIAGAGAVGALR